MFSRNGRTPTTSPLPFMMARRDSADSFDHGTSMRIFFLRQKRTSWLKKYSNFSLAHGSMAWSLSERVGSGTMSASSNSRRLPKPRHDGHAPYGVLNENRIGRGSSNVVPHALHTSLF